MYEHLRSVELIELFILLRLYHKSTGMKNRKIHKELNQMVVAGLTPPALCTRITAKAAPTRRQAYESEAVKIFFRSIQTK